MPRVEVVDQPFGRDDGAAMEHKDREERTLSRTADINRAAVLLDLGGSQEFGSPCLRCNRL